VKRLYIDDYTDIVELMYEKVCGSCEEATFIGLYEDAVEILKQLVILDETDIHQVSIVPEDWDGYDKEYIVTLDNSFDIWCEKLYRCETESYIRGLAGCVIIADDCNRDAIREPETDDIYIASFGDVDALFEEDECECNGNCECCAHYGMTESNEEDEELLTDSRSESFNVSRTKDGRIAGFTKSWSDTAADGTISYSSYSYYGSNEDIVKKLAKEFRIDI